MTPALAKSISNPICKGGVIAPPLVWPRMRPIVSRSQQTSGGVVIVDYGMGNLRTVEKAIEANGARKKSSALVKYIKNTQKLVVPGVGAFPRSMRELKARKLIGPIKDKVKSG